MISAGFSHSPFTDHRGNHVSDTALMERAVQDLGACGLRITKTRLEVFVALVRNWHLAGKDGPLRPSRSGRNSTKSFTRCLTEFERRGVIDRLTGFLGSAESGSVRVRSKAVLPKALIGSGGHAREVMAQMGMRLPCFVDDAYATKDSLKLSAFDPEKFEVMVAVGDASARKKVVDRLPKGTRFFTWVHPTALILEDVTIGEGSFVGAYSILTTNIAIGRHALINRGNHVGHDAIVGDYLSMMPGAIISGSARLGDEVFLGSNACVREKAQICSRAKFGMGAMVVSDILNEGTYVGVPARKLAGIRIAKD